MAIIVPTPLTPYATPPSTNDPTNFDARADAKVAADQVFVTEANTQMTVLYGNALETYNNATSASASAASATVNASNAAASAGATAWVSGTTYSIGAQKISPANLRVYRKTTATAGGAVDPSANTTDWAPVSTNIVVVTTTALSTLAVSNTHYEVTNVASRTNLCLYSRDFSNAAWTKSQCAVAVELSTGPDGLALADQITISTASSTSTYIHQVPTVTGHANNTFTIGFDVKNVNFGGTIGFYLQDGSGTTVASSTATAITTSWKRYSLTGTFGASPAANIRFFIVFENGTAGQTLFIDNAQLELGTLPTPAISTNTATATEGPCVILPASPLSGDVVSVSSANGLTNTWVGRNNNLIAGPGVAVQTDNIKLDAADTTFNARYTGTLWRMF